MEYWRKFIIIFLYILMCSPCTNVTPYASPAQGLGFTLG